MPIGLKQKKIYLDREHCFRTWINCGSIGKTVKILQSEGMTNPKTGKAPTPMGVWGSAWLWVFDNMAEAKIALRDVWRYNGEVYPDVEFEKIWSKLVLGKAKYLLSNKQYLLWLENHSYLKPFLEK